MSSVKLLSATKRSEVEELGAVTALVVEGVQFGRTQSNAGRLSSACLRLGVLLRAKSATHSSVLLVAFSSKYQGLLFRPQAVFNVLVATSSSDFSMTIAKDRTALLTKYPRSESLRIYQE
jgi:hypothetical protein